MDPLQFAAPSLTRNVKPVSETLQTFTQGFCDTLLVNAVAVTITVLPVGNAVVKVTVGDAVEPVPHWNVLGLVIFAFESILKTLGLPYWLSVKLELPPVLFPICHG